jgi:hypothetical protein
MEDDRMSESAGQGSNGQRNGGGTQVSFSDVARAHHDWDAATDGANERARVEFERKLELFEHESQSKLVEAYWCRKRASAVALAERLEPPDTRRWLTRRLQGPRVPEYRIHRETDWLTGGFTRLADLLHECDVLAIKAIYGLEGFQQALVMQWLLRVEAHILGYIEWRHAPPQPADSDQSNAARGARAARADLDAFYKRMLRELNRIEDYYQAAGEKRARLHYVAGMIFMGMLLATGAAIASGVALSIFGLLDLNEPGVRRFYACMAAGAIGAVVSVLMRMSGRRGSFTIDHELGAVGVRRVGAFRPLIGAVCGVVISFLVQTSLVPIKPSSLSIEFYVVVAFLAGFSERWTRVILDGAMRTVDPAGDAADSQAAQSR